MEIHRKGLGPFYTTAAPRMRASLTYLRHRRSIRGHEERAVKVKI